MTIPCTALAREAGDERLTCVVALGALLARRAVVTRDAALGALTDIVGKKHPEILAADIAGFEAGWRAAIGTGDPVGAR